MSDNDDMYGKIIDCHAHIGSWSADSVDFTEELLNDAFDEPFEVEVGDDVEENEVAYVLVSNMSGIDTKPDGTPRFNEKKTNRFMLDVCAKNPKLKAMLVGQPGYGDAANLIDTIERRPNEVFGIKLHPNTLRLNANDPLYEPYMAVAERYNLPVLFHSQSGWSSPLYIFETARKFPLVPTILGHLGMGDDANHFMTFGILEAALKSGAANLYADISWLTPETTVRILEMSDEETLSHLLFGTDIPLGPFSDPSYYPQRVSELKTAIAEEFEEEEAMYLIHKLFFQNSFDLFFAPKNF